MMPAAMTTPFRFISPTDVRRNLLYGSIWLLIPTLLARSAVQGTLDFNVLMQSCAFTALYVLMGISFYRGSLWQLTLAWLGLPLLQFSFFWLQWIPALLLTGLWGYALWQTAQLESVDKTQPARFPHWGALALLLVWVYLSGAGGYGLQKDDYILHNSRLTDLIDYSWPVHFSHVGRWFTDPAYGPDFTLFVMYSAYYLPSAFIGKWLGNPAGFEAIHVWTLAGVWLAFRWLSRLSDLKRPFCVAAALIFFGSWDMLIEWKNILATVHAVLHLPIWHLPFDWKAIEPHAPLIEPNFLDFWPSVRLHTDYFFGHYVSTSANLFWAPHQTVAGWLTASLLMHAWQQQRDKVLCFVYALLALWSPMNLMATTLLPLAFVLRQGMTSLKDSISWHNALAGGSLLCVLGLYYVSGSAFTNPGAGFLWQNPNLQWSWLAIFHLVSWGVYALATGCFAWHTFDRSTRQLFSIVCLSLLLLPLFRYGEYSDLVTRGSGALMFLLLALFLKCVQHTLNTGRRTTATLLLCLLIPGAGSGILSVASSILRYEQQTQGQSVIWYGEGWLFMGRQSSPFGTWLAEPPE